MITDQVKNIPAGLVKYLGEGEMVLPSSETIQFELDSLSDNALITLPILRKRIAEKFQVTTACPKSTLFTLRSMLDASDSGAWKVINGKGGMISKTQENQGQKLIKAGYTLVETGKKWKVVGFKQYLS